MRNTDGWLSALGILLLSSCLQTFDTDAALVDGATDAFVVGDIAANDRTNDQGVQADHAAMDASDYDVQSDDVHGIDVVFVDARHDASSSDVSRDASTADTCVVGQAIETSGCVCGEAHYSSGYCCNNGWRGVACNYTAKTCAELGVSNCVEVWPGEQRTGYEYNAEHKVYLFGNLSNADHYFLLMGDISGDKTSTVFGFQDGNPDVDASTVFDLNGYTVTYSAADYPTLSNNGFEQWQNGEPVAWTLVSGAVEARDTAYWMPMHGDKVLYSPGAVVLESSTVSLPVGRAYRGYVTIGRAAETDISLQVINSNGDVVCSETKPGYFRGQSLACRFDVEQAGSYHLRLTTQGYAYFDRTGIVPLSDYGVGIFTSWSLSDSNQSQNPIVQNLTGVNIPASGDHASPARYNHIEVKNGKIVAAHENQESYGVSLSGIVRLSMHGVAIYAKGLKSRTVTAAGEIWGNHLEVDMPWYFARENSTEENVVLRGGSFHDNVAIGGQGVIRLSGTGTQVYNNYLRNNAQSTNHYAIIHSGAVNAEIHHNIFDPIEGSGILTYVGHGYRIHDNVFYVRTATCNVEYINEDYSTNGIRMNDYGAETNFDNWVYNNTFYIEGRDFDTAWDNCMPVTTGIFYSASGADNKIYGNTFYITKTNDNQLAPVYALYMGGDAYNKPVDNKLVYDNTFVANDKAIWVTTFYGDSANLWFENNTFRKVENTYYTPSMPEAAIQMGRGSSDADNVRLINNHFEGGFDAHAIYFTAVNSAAAYDLSLQWYVHVHVVDSAGQAVAGATVQANSISQTEQREALSDANGDVLLTLTEYNESGDMTANGAHNRVTYTPHRVTASYGGLQGQIESIDVNSEQSVTITLAD